MMNTVQQMSSFEFQMVCAVRLILASCCGLCIGIERTNRLKDAGIRTHLIVCMGAALMMLVSKYGFFDVSPLTEFFKADVSRVASSVVSGVGFLGAGYVQRGQLVQRLYAKVRQKRVGRAIQYRVADRVLAPHLGYKLP